MQFGNATINMAKFSKLANRFGEEEATRQLREQYVTNPAEKAFLERQNDIGYNAVDQGARVKFGGSFDHPFADSPSMQSLYGGDFDVAQDANARANYFQDTRRRGGQTRGRFFSGE